MIRVFCAGGEVGMTIKGPKIIFLGDWNVLYHDYGGGYMGVYTCENS